MFSSLAGSQAKALFTGLFLALIAATTLTGAEPACEAEQLLQNAQQSLSAGRCDDAARKLKKAEKLPADAELQARIAVFRRDLYTVVRLEEIRHDYPTTSKADLDRPALLGQYVQLFSNYGFGLESSALEAFENRAFNSSIRVPLAAGLDDWARALPIDDKATRNKLLEVADLLDTSPWRREVRAAVRADDRLGLLRLSQNLAPEAITTPTLTLLAKSLECVGEPAAVIDLLRRSRKYYPGEIWIDGILGTILVQQQPPQPAEAFECSQAILAKHPGLAYAYPLRVIALTQMRRYVEAEAEARLVLRLKPNWSRSHFSLASTLAAAADGLETEVAKAKLPEAEAECRFALRQDENADGLNLLGSILWAQKKPTEAESVFRRAMALYPESADALIGLGAALRARQQYEEAEKRLREGVARKRTGSRGYLQLGYLLMERGRNAEAEQSLREAVRLEPDNAEGRAWLGAVLWSQGKLIEAELSCREAIRLNPDATVALRCLGFALLGQSRYTEAEVIARKLLQLDSNDIAGLKQMGMVLMEQKMYKEAAVLFRQGMKLFPKDADYYNNLGWAVKEEHPDEAIRLFREALRLNPGHTLARNNLAVMHAAPEEADPANPLPPLPEQSPSDKSSR